MSEEASSGQSTPHQIDFRRKVQKGEGLWLLSFTDMCMTLMCFFILMISMMSFDKVRYENVRDGITREVRKSPNLPQLEQWISKAIKERKLEDSASVQLSAEGLHIEFKSAMLFQSGSAQENPRFQEVMQQVLKVIARVPPQYHMTVVGHTDDVPMRDTRFGSNWELSAARGFSLMRRFHSLGVAEKQISVTAQAHTRPKVAIDGLNGKELEKARAANRRVEILIE